MYNPFPENIRHIAIVSPAGEPQKSAVYNACGKIDEMGIRSTIMPNVFARSKGKSLPSSIESRVSDIHECWKDSSIDLILSARGGYGSARILESLDWDLLRRRKVPFLGYSDITALHLAMLRKNVGIPVSSPVAAEFSAAIEDEFTANSLYRALLFSTDLYPLIMPLKSDIRIIKRMETEGKVLPVNLTVLTSLMGTPCFPELEGCILLIEDINEPVYKIDRCLTQLKSGGVLSKCSGLLFGNFRRCGNKKDKEKIFAEFAEFVNGPVISGIPFGHCFPRISLCFGTKIKISSNGDILL